MQGEYMAKHLPEGAKIVYLRATVRRAVPWDVGKGSKKPALPSARTYSCSLCRCRMEPSRGAQDNDSLDEHVSGDQIVVAGNDEMALGAVQSTQEGKTASRAGLDLRVDATPAGLAAVTAGEMVQTVKQDAKGQGRSRADARGGFIKGNPAVKRHIDSFSSITRKSYRTVGNWRRAAA